MWTAAFLEGTSSSQILISNSLTQGKVVVFSGRQQEELLLQQYKIGMTKWDSSYFI